jgi:alpha-aminoadipate/glutamate carrier protein LysW
MMSDQVAEASAAGLSAACPLCAAAVPGTATFWVNEVIECGDCSGELEVVSLSPFLLAVAPEVEEDWGE